MPQRTLIACLIAFALALFGLGLFFVIKERMWRNRIQYRLRPTKSNQPALKVERFDLLQTDTPKDDGFLAQWLAPLNKLLGQTGPSLGATSILVSVLACVSFGIALAYVTKLSLLIAAPAGVGLGFMLPILVLRALRERRQRQFEEQLPEAIDTLVRGLKAGHSVAAAIGSVIQNMADPIGGEFQITAAEMTYGLDLETAMANMHTRVGQPDIALIALAVSMQGKTGGNLSEILANMSRVIRERFKLRRKAKALTAEGRFSAMVLSALPVFLFMIICFVTPDYYSEVWSRPYTKAVLVSAFLWMVLGNYIMFRMVRIRI